MLIELQYSPLCPGRYQPSATPVDHGTRTGTNKQEGTHSHDLPQMVLSWAPNAELRLVATEDTREAESPRGQGCPLDRLGAHAPPLGPLGV